MKEDNSKSKLVCNTFNAEIVIEMFNANNDINFKISKNGKYICNIDGCMVFDIVVKEFLKSPSTNPLIQRRKCQIVHGLVEGLKIFKSQS